MKRTILVIIVCAALSPLLNGCWNSKDIQHLGFVTAIGFDYKDDKYIAQVQILNFSSIAKSESIKIGESIPAWTGTGEGATLTDAINSLFSTSQLTLYWGHVKAIVMTESYMQEPGRIKLMYELLNRYREVRYNILVYGTTEPLIEVFTTLSLLNLPPLDTLLDNPFTIYSLGTFVRPVYNFTFISRIYEPASFAVLPSLSINRKMWTEGTKTQDMFKIDGAYFFKDLKYAGWLSRQQLEGFRWAQKDLLMFPISIPSSENQQASVNITKPKFKISYKMHDGQVRFRIHVTAGAHITQLIVPLSKQRIEQMSAEVIKAQIEETFQNALEKKIDVYDLGYYMYRTNYKVWKSLDEKSSFILNEQSLEQIDVKVILQHSGKYRLRT